MKIQPKSLHKPSDLTFNNLWNGDVFVVAPRSQGDIFYMRIPPTSRSADHLVNAVDLESGIPVFFSQDSFVEKVDGVFVESQEK